MSDITYDYYNQLDTLDLPDLEFLAKKIHSLISSKKKHIIQKLKKDWRFLTA